MSVIFWTSYWLLGDGADEEAKRWVAVEPHKEIVWSSSRAVEIREEGKYLSPILPVPPKGFMIFAKSYNDADEGGPMIGICDGTAECGGWLPVDDE
jgi:hypothetical protein